jgi:hypothetical protein
MQGPQKIYPNSYFGSENVPSGNPGPQLKRIEEAQKDCKPTMQHESRVTRFGRIFANWAIICFGQISFNYNSSPKIWATLSHGKIVHCF